jgi:hypothetical protein
VFLGNPVLTKAKFATARDDLASMEEPYKGRVRFITLLGGFTGSARSVLDGSAHAQYGAIDVIRPGIILGFKAGLSDSSVITKYFNKFFNYLSMEFRSHWQDFTSPLALTSQVWLSFNSHSTAIKETPSLILSLSYQPFPSTNSGSQHHILIQRHHQFDDSAAHSQRYQYQTA